MEKELLNRNLYRQLKSMDKNELSRILNNIYEMGKEDAMKGIEAIDIDMDNMIESNPIYKAIITKDMLCVGWDGKVVKKVMNALNDGE